LASGTAHAATLAVVNNSEWLRHSVNPARLLHLAGSYIEHFYNRECRHSSLGYLTPNEFEVAHSTPIEQAGHFVLTSGPPNGLKPIY
jgi:hypothetical protein